MIYGLKKERERYKQTSEYVCEKEEWMLDIDRKSNVEMAVKKKQQAKRHQPSVPWWGRQGRYSRTILELKSMSGL